MAIARTVLPLAQAPLTRVPSRSSTKEQTRIVSQTLLQQVASGNEQAMRQCIDTHGGLVWSLARRFLSSRAEAEDAVQDIFTDVWRSSKRYNPDIASETTFIAMIARRRLIDRVRRKTARPAETAVPEEIINDQRVDNPRIREEFEDEDVTRAAKALNKLSVDQQRVIRLSVLEGKSHDQISKATGLPLGTVKTHARRGMIKLREIMTDSTSSTAAGASS